MITPVSIPLLLAAGIMMYSCNNSGNEGKPIAFSSEILRCGTVQLTDACGKGIDSFVSYGLALVHHMTYDEAEKVFDEVIAANPDCFWGHWGKALTFIHPVWSDEPGEEKMKSGLVLTQKALDVAKGSREKVFGATLAAFYRDTVSKTHKERLKTYADAWAAASEKLPEDQEARAFYALTLIATADPADKTYKNQLKAGELAEQVLKEIPDHPGSFHYLIHAYDYPELADKAVQAAARYDKIAPEVPHALHMPTHIFTRLGLWKESIAWNLRSAEAALKFPVNGNISLHYFHALDYLAYAYLQRQEDDKALEILSKAKNIKGSVQSNPATAYALAAGEGRFALERKQWEKAAGLELVTPEGFSWDKYPEYEALTHFAIGLGAARSGNKAKAQESINRLETLQQKAGTPYWKGQIEIQKNAVKAWFAFSENKKDEALTLMTLAANQETATNKHPVTPGELLPATELLGDMLTELNKPGDAIQQYELALKRSPGRYNSLAGAAKAARLSGDKEKENHFTKLLEKLTDKTDARVASVDKII